MIRESPLSVVKLIAWMLTVGLMFESTVTAAEFRSGETPVVKGDEVVEDDLYIAGDEVVIEGQVQGDLVAFARILRVNGTVDGDVIAAGQAVVINGTVGDDLRVAAQALKLDQGATIADDVIGAAFSMEMVEASSIGGDLVYAGYQASLGGEVSGETRAGVANCEVSGKLIGDVNLGVGGDDAGAQAYTGGSPPPISLPSVPPGLTIRDTAELQGNLYFESPREANIAENAKIGGTIEHVRPQVEPRRPPTAGQRAFRIAGQYGTLFVIGLCLVLIAPAWTRRLTTNMREKPLASFGLGIAGIAGFCALLVALLVGMVLLAVIAGLLHLTGLLPVIIVLGITSVVTLVVGFWLYVGYLAKILVGYFAGSLLIQPINRSLGQNRFVALIIGLIVLALIAMLPYAGAIVGWIAVLLSLGALILWMFSVCWTSSKTSPSN